MMKRRIIKSIILLGLVCITGCGEIKNNKGEEKTSASESSLFQMVEKKDYSEETINLDGKVSDDVLCETLEKKDASQQASYNSLNRMCSFVVENNQKSLFCIDDVTGAVYFVNQYRDWYIYRLWEGKAELAVALPAKELYMWDGTLYFMAESYGLYDLENISDGDIFAYTPKEGVVELVYAAGETMKEEKSSLAKNSQKMTVSETGVHFIGDIKTKMIEYEGMKLMSKEETPYSLLFGTKEPIEDSYNMTKAGWGDYYFGITVGEKGNKLILCPRDMKQTADKTIDLQIENSKMYAALDNELFYLIGKEVCVKNLVTDESMAYDYTDIMSQVYADEIAEAESRVGQTYLNKNTNEYFVMEYRDPVPTVTNFTVTGNTIWISDYNGYLYSRNRETGDTAVYQVAEEYTIEALYTDGENLYIADSFEVVRALTGEAKKNEEGIYILKTEPLVK